MLFNNGDGYGNLYWGDWGKVEYCPNDGKAMGFTLLTERSQGNGDDTALNAIALKCTSGSRIYSTARPYVNKAVRLIKTLDSFLFSASTVKEIGVKISFVYLAIT